MTRALLSIIALAAVFSLGITPVFAVQPYTAAYPHFTAETAKQFWFYTDFNGLHDSSQWTASVQSTSGADSNDDMNGIIYQQAAKLQTNEDVDADAEVWDGTTIIFDCSEWTNGCPMLNTDVDNIDYIYQTMYWNSARDQVTFVWQTFKTGGGSDTDSGTYDVEIGDNSENFLVGTQDYNGKRIKNYQFGIESSDESSNVDVDQYDSGWVEIVGGVTYGEDKNGYQTNYDTSSDTHHSRITEDGGTIYAIGLEEYNGINADYEKKTGSSLGPGHVQWYDDTLTIGLGKHLWDP